MSGSKTPDLETRYEGFDLAVPLDEQEADAILESAGVKPAEALARLLSRMDQAEDEIRAETYGKAAEERRAFVGRLETKRSSRPRAELLAILATMRSQGVELQAMYKNLDNVPDEDLESLVAELELMAEDDEKT